MQVSNGKATWLYTASRPSRPSVSGQAIQTSDDRYRPAVAPRCVTVLPTLKEQLHKARLWRRAGRAAQSWTMRG